MTDTTQANNGAQVSIPAAVQEKYPDIAEMIMKSVSMDNEERNYWFSVLPVMTDDQVKELRDILESEQKKLAQIEANEPPNPAGSIAPPAMSEEDIKKAEEERRQRREERVAAEQKQQEESEEDAEALLAELDNL